MATWLGPPVEKYDYGTNGGSWTRQPALICLHSTEGTGWTNYNGGSVAPHFTIEPKSGEIHQHISMSHAARALAHPSGTPETNRAGVIQIEIIGTCDPSHRGQSSWNFLPDMSDAQAANIGKLVDMIRKAIPAIPLKVAAEFEPYPEPSYGSGHPRMSTSAFAKAVGVLGHQHVPSNSHGDPGNIPIDKILGASGGEDMPTFVHLTISEPYDLPGGKWMYVTWDGVGGGPGSPSDVVANPGSASVEIGGKNFASTLLLGARIPTGATLETKLTYGDLSGDGGSYKVKDQRMPAVLRGGGDAYILDTRNDGCPGGQKARWMAGVSEPGQLLKADLTLLYW